MSKFTTGMKVRITINCPNHSKILEGTIVTLIRKADDIFHIEDAWYVDFEDEPGSWSYVSEEFMEPVEVCNSVASVESIEIVTRTTRRVFQVTLDENQARILMKNTTDDALFGQLEDILE